MLVCCVNVTFNLLDAPFRNEGDVWAELKEGLGLRLEAKFSAIFVSILRRRSLHVLNIVIRGIFYEGFIKWIRLKLLKN